MKRGAFQISLVIAICSLMLAFPASFLRYANLAIIPPFCTIPNFENSDQEDQLEDHLNGSDVFLSYSLSVVFLLGIYYLEGICHLPFLPSFLGQGNFFLRC